MGILNPLLELGLVLVIDTHNGQKLVAQFDVGDFIDGANVVRLANFALVNDGIEGVAGVAGEKIAASGTAVAVKDDWPAAV